MNAGFSTVAALMLHPEMHAHSFDLLEWRYTPVVADFISTLFPGRHRVHAGSSFKLLPKFAAGEGRGTCDAALIDGAHTFDGAAKDIANMRPARRCKSVVFLDDLDSPAGKAVHEAVKQGTLEILQEFEFPARSIPSCMRMYNPKKKRKPKFLESVAAVEAAYTLEWDCPTSDRAWSFAIARYRNLADC